MKEIKTCKCGIAVTDCIYHRPIAIGANLGSPELKAFLNRQLDEFLRRIFP